MYRLATKCPHCGALAPPRDVDADEDGQMTVEEAKALLQATTAPRKENFADIAGDFVMPWGGALELVTSVLAAPLTLFTVLVTGYFLLKERADAREAKLAGTRMFAVPVCAVLGAVLLWSQGANVWALGALGVSFGAWGLRTVVRGSGREDLR